MASIIKTILDIIGRDNQGSKLSINFYGNDIWFNIYETEVCVVVDVDKKYVYLDCEVGNHQLTKDMVFEMYQIIRLLENNIEEVISVYQKEKRIPPLKEVGDEFFAW